MTIFGVKRGYLASFVICLLIGIGFAIGANLNVFAEIGTVIVVVSIWRAYRGVVKLNWSADTFSALADEGQRTVLRWDAIAVLIGTVTNGFAVWVFKLVQLICCDLTNLWPQGWPAPIPIACCGT